MSKIVLAPKTLNQEALFDVLSLHGRGNIPQAIFTAVSHFFSAESMLKNPEYLYENILPKEAYERMKKGEDILEISMDLSEGKRVRKFREKEKEISTGTGGKIKEKSEESEEDIF